MTNQFPAKNSPLPIAVLASGKGSNFATILSEAAAGRCPVQINLLLSDKEGAGALQVARDFGLPHLHLNPREYADRRSFDAACAEAIAASGAELIVLAGYMRILSAEFVQRFAGRIINIHPSLLPAFPGGHAVRDALNFGVKLTGCTVHLVDELVDNGPILAQQAVPVADDDDEPTLHQRIHDAEHQLYPATLTRIAREGFRLVERRVVWGQ